MAAAGTVRCGRDSCVARFAWIEIDLVDEADEKLGPLAPVGLVDDAAGDVAEHQADLDLLVADLLKERRREGAVLAGAVGSYVT